MHNGSISILIKVNIRMYYITNKLKLGITNRPKLNLVCVITTKLKVGSIIICK